MYLLLDKLQSLIVPSSTFLISNIQTKTHMDNTLLIIAILALFFRISLSIFRACRKKLKSITELQEANKTFQFTKHSKKPLGIQKRMLNLKQYKYKK